MHYPFNKEKDYYAFANIDDFIFECVNYKEKRYKDINIYTAIKNITFPQSER